MNFDYFMDPCGGASDITQDDRQILSPRGHEAQIPVFAEADSTSRQIRTIYGKHLGSYGVLDTEIVAGKTWYQIRLWNLRSGWVQRQGTVDTRENVVWVHVQDTSIYVAYDAIFRPISWRSRLALLSVLHFRADTVRKGRWYFTRNLREARTFSAARGVVAEFLDDLRRKEQAKLDEEERLRRYSGSQELDDEGRRLDRREFTGTIDALRWLATCQMGWHRRCGRYRCDLLKFLNDDIVGYGLPRESDIRLPVAEDGQLWYAWRRTVTGWCFAIGAAGPPPDQWRYDGPGPPKGFPGKDSSWGDGPFADRVNRNWF